MRDVYTYGPSRTHVLKYRCEGCGIWKADPSGLCRSHHPCQKRKLEETVDEPQPIKKRRVSDEEPLIRPADLSYASSSRKQADAFLMPNPYDGPVAGSSGTSDYTAYSDDLGSNNRGLLSDFAYTNGLWGRQDDASSLDDLRGATVTPVHMDAPADARVYNQTVEGHIAGGQQWYNEPGPSAGVAPQAFAPPQPEPPSFGLDWNAPLCANDEFRPPAQPQFHSQPSIDAQPVLDAQPVFDAQPQFYAEPQYNNQPYFDAEVTVNNQPDFGPEPQPFWQYEPYEQPWSPLALEPILEPQHIPPPPLAQPVPVSPTNFQLFEPAFPLEVPPEPLAYDLAFVPQQDGVASPAAFYADAPLTGDLPLYEDILGLYDAPAFDVNNGLNFDWGLDAGLEGILQPDSWALAFDLPLAPNPLAPNAAYGAAGEPLLAN